jgi:hypothetical protein
MDFIDIFQQRQIHETGERSRSAIHRANQAELDLPAIERRLDRLTLIAQALWEILRDRAELQDAELIDKIAEIDLRDGTQDGKISRQILDCPACRRKVSNKRAFCLYCGAQITSNPFESV